jgi:hypothetical protein
MLNTAKYTAMAVLSVGLAIGATKPASAWDYGYGPYFYGFANTYPYYGYAYPYPYYGYYRPYYRPYYYGYRYGYRPYYHRRHW